MGTFLTTREIQDLINVDRSTVYRMAEDGRLPGVKVGRQWRFPAARVAEQLGLDRPSAETAGARPSRWELRQLLVPEAAQSVADLLGDLFGVMAVVTDMDGRPLTSVAHPCGFYAAVADRRGRPKPASKGGVSWPTRSTSRPASCRRTSASSAPAPSSASGRGSWA